MSLLNLTASEMVFWQKRNNQAKKVKTFIVAEYSECGSHTSQPEQHVTPGCWCSWRQTAGGVSDWVSAPCGPRAESTLGHK